MADEQSTVRTGPQLPPNTYLPIAAASTAPGMPLSQSTSVDGTVNLAKADSINTAYCVGLAARGAAAGDRVHTQYGDLLTLTTAEWDAVTGGSGGLTPGSPYYVSAATAGHLTTSAPGSGGQFVVPVGIATSPTTMRVQLSFTKVNG